MVKTSLKQAQLSSTLSTGRPMSSFTKLYRDFWNDNPTPPQPPYSHVCQIGDPILRCKAEEVHPDFIKTPEIQRVIKMLKSVLKHYKAVGLSAPQIGVSLRIMLVDFSDMVLKEFSPEIRAAREMIACPPTIVINPTLKIVDPQPVVFTEGCTSVFGFSAAVARSREVHVSGLDEDAQPLDWQAKGWLARIIQHEMDHLDGKVMTDIMDQQTFQLDSWYSVNMTRGKVRHRYF